MDEQTAKSPEEFICQLNEKLQELPKSTDTWTANHLLELKYVLRNVHAHITYLVGKKFLDTIGVQTADFAYDKMYDNGFDIEIVQDDFRLLAEIKANLPVNNNHTRYGAAQEDGIKDDIKGLFNGKEKAKNEAFKTNIPDDTYRFLILLDHNRDAFDALLSKLCGEGGQRGRKPNKLYERDKFVVHEQPVTLGDVEPDVIHVVFVKL